MDQGSIQTAVRAIVLAAGKGKRLQSEQCDLPKVLRTVQGRPMLQYVLEALGFLRPEDVLLILGYKADQVQSAVSSLHPVVLQQEQLGTGHAVACARSWILEDDRPVLVCCGDMPLLQTETFQGLIQTQLQTGAACTVLSCTTPEEWSFGRIVRNAEGRFDQIVEAKDCNAEQRAIREYNAGVYVFDPKALVRGLDSLKNDNAQKEYYLTDVPGFLREAGQIVEIYQASSMQECMGVNTEADLQAVEACLCQGGKK